MSRSRVLCAAVVALLVPMLLPWTPVEAQGAKGSAPAYGTAYARKELLVPPAMLKDHLGDRNLVLLQVGPKATYDSAHVTGAQFVELMNFSTPRKEGTLALEMPSVEELRATLEKFGISDDSRIVVIPSAEWNSPATRVMLTLDYMGFGDRSMFLNGGLEVWKKAGYPVSTAVPTPTRGHITPRAPLPLIVDNAFVQNLSQNNGSTPHTKLIDARNSEFYEGPPHMGTPVGHIKGAVSIPFDAVYDDSSRVLAPELLAQKFKAAGLAPGDTVVAYCHIGQQATALLFTARLMGHPVRLYDGSMNDWEMRKLPIEGGRK